MTNYILKIKTLFTQPTVSRLPLSDIIYSFNRNCILISRKSEQGSEYLSVIDTVPTVISILKIEDENLTKIKQWVFYGSKHKPEEFNQSALELNSFLNYYQTLNQLEVLD